jgi:hypothetical protein
MFSNCSLDSLPCQAHTSPMKVLLTTLQAIGVGLCAGILLAFLGVDFDNKPWWAWMLAFGAFGIIWEVAKSGIATAVKEKIGLVIIVLLLAPLGAGAQESPVDRLIRAIGQDRNLISHWSFVIQDEASWKRSDNRFTNKTFTVLTNTTTYVRESWLIHAPISEVRRSLLHEGGHLWCRCSSETVAEKWAYEHAH